MMYSEILDFHNVDNVDGSQFLGTPTHLTTAAMENPDASTIEAANAAVAAANNNNFAPQ